jgi:DNA invertase Pin-like site-specific DNA recombinase
VVMAWSVDRLGRSLQDLVGFLSEIHAAGVDLFLHQQGIDTTSPGGKAMFQMLGVFAEFERSIIQERVRAGLRRAKAEGKQLGRPRIAPELEARILAALKVPGRTNSRKAVDVAQKLSHQLRAAEQRISELEAEAEAYRQKSERAEQWLHHVYSEIEDRFLRQSGQSSGQVGRSLSQHPN